MTITRSHDRAPSETSLTISLPVDKKKLLKRRAEDSDRTVSQVVRYAIEYCEKIKWKGIPEMEPYIK
jgi:predicted transcriptional regulator